MKSPRRFRPATVPVFQYTRHCPTLKTVHVPLIPRKIRLPRHTQYGISDCNRDIDHEPFMVAKHYLLGRWWFVYRNARKPRRKRWHE